jgi:hypothetical protein
MNIYLLDPKDIDPNITDLENMPYTAMRKYSQLDKRGVHRVVQSPDDADLVVCPTPSRSSGVIFRELSMSDVFRNSFSKLFVYCTDDIIMPRLPGLYPGTTPKWAKAGWTAGAHYITDLVTKFNFSRNEYENLDRPLLFSFVGSVITHPIRQEIMLLEHSNSLMHASSSTGGGEWWRSAEDERAKFRDLFRQTLIDSKFVLCPRGRVASSIRTFEALEVGAVPVIIADDIVLPEGPNWDQIALKVPENAISRIPEIIESSENRYQAMSTAGRAAWEEYFAPETSFHTVVEGCAKLHECLSLPKRRSMARTASIYSWTNLPCIRARARFLRRRLKSPSAPK